MDELNGLIRSNGIPDEMATKLRAFFIQTRAKREAEVMGQLLNDMSPTLQARVVAHTSGYWIRKVPYIPSSVTDLFVAQLAIRLAVVIYAQAEKIAEPATLFIVSRGVAMHG